MIEKAYGIVGMPGSGKSEIVKVGEEMNIPVVVMGDAIREDLTEKGIEITPDNMGKYALEVRKEFGMDIVAKKSFNKISN
ncbi:MAG: AAA family ATPase, partial [Candidatus Helarchaeota archaeon]|nr:AAA family ATPase [Candidatus Helarchaeota archaeon]